MAVYACECGRQAVSRELGCMQRDCPTARVSESQPGHVFGRRCVIRVTSEIDERFGEWWHCARVEGYPDVWRRHRDRAIGVAQSQVFEECARVARDLCLVPDGDVPTFDVVGGA